MQSFTSDTESLWLNHLKIGKLMKNVSQTESSYTRPNISSRPKRKRARADFEVVSDHSESDEDDAFDCDDLSDEGESDLSPKENRRGTFFGDQRRPTSPAPILLSATQSSPLSASSSSPLSPSGFGKLSPQKLTRASPQGFSRASPKPLLLPNLSFSSPAIPEIKVNQAKSKKDLGGPMKKGESVMDLLIAPGSGGGGSSPKEKSRCKTPKSFRKTRRQKNLSVLSTLDRRSDTNLSLPDLSFKGSMKDLPRNRSQPRKQLNPSEPLGALDEMGEFLEHMAKSHQQMVGALRKTHRCFKDEVLQHIAAANRASEAHETMLEGRNQLEKKKMELEKKVTAAPQSSKLTSRLMETDKSLRLADAHLKDSEDDVLTVLDAVDRATKALTAASMFELFRQYKSAVEVMSENVKKYDAIFESAKDPILQQQEEAVSEVQKAVQLVPPLCEKSNSLLEKKQKNVCLTSSLNLMDVANLADVLQASGEKKEFKPEVHAVELLKVNKDHKTNKRVEVDVANGRLTFYHIKHQTRLVRRAAEIIQIRRNLLRDKPLSIQWSSRDDPESFIFHKKIDREYFYAAAHKARSLTITPPKDVSLFMVTWNMGNAAPPDDINCLLPPGHDIYAICGQEAEYAPKDSTYPSCETEWFDQLRTTLGDDYVQLTSCTLLYIRMIILVKKKLYFHISNVQRSTVATGIAGVLGNKGGVGISFHVCETRILIVGAHLAAHAERFAVRNENYCEIVKGLKLAPSGLDLFSYFHHVLWFGDLNYRINLSRTETIERIVENDFETLREYDQLLEERKAERCFVGFKEGLVNFRPTYRYERGSRVYSTEKMRIPSWCDRVMWRSLPNAKIELKSYGCCDEIKTSDHSPVFASLLIQPQLPYLQDPLKSTPLQISITNFTVLLSDDKYNQKINVSFWSPFLETPPTIASLPAASGIISFPNQVLVSLKPVITDEENLKEQFICVILTPKKTGKAGKTNDSSFGGQGSFGLSNESVKKSSLGIFPVLPFSFDIVSKEGLRVGQASGKVQITMPSNLSEESSNSILLRGYLLKRGGRIQSWKRRWFELTGLGRLSYFESEGGKLLGQYSVINCKVAATPTDKADRQNSFSVETPTRTWYYVADTGKGMKDWMAALKAFSDK